jgi:hypothetical protein
MEYLGCCGNICSLLSCYADFKNFVEKVCPCMRKKEQPPKFKEETYKITFLGTTLVKFEKIEENISQD